MKFRLLILILFLATNLIKNAESVDEGGKESKLFKSFDEIFGKGWDAEVPEFTETKEWHKMETQTTEVENKSTDQPNPNEQIFSDHYESFANRKIRERFDEMFDENWSEEDNEFIEEDEADSTDQNDCIDGQNRQKAQENGDPGTKRIKRPRPTNVYSDQQKLEIVQKFIKINNQYKHKGKYSQKESEKEWQKIYAKISNSIGVSHKTIKKWKKEFGLNRSIKLHSKQERVEKLKQYCEIKNNNPKIRDFEIAEILNIGGSTLRQWKSALKNAVKDENDCSLQKELSQISPTKIYSDQQKRELLKQFDQIKRKCKKTKLKNISMRELDKKIAKKLGVSTATIIVWKRKFGLSVSNKFSDATKIGILKKYAKIKRKNPKMTNAVIADMLNISTVSLDNWNKQFKEEIKNL